jgi:hypothetical protein
MVYGEYIDRAGNEIGVYGEEIGVHGTARPDDKTVAQFDLFFSGEKEKINEN